MPKNCPECGAPIDFQVTAAHLESGTCSGCDHTILILGAGGPPLVAPAPAPDPAATEDAAEEADAFSMRCPECGADTELTARGKGAIAAECTSCEQTFVFRLQRSPASGEEGEPERRPFAPRGGPRSFGRGGDAPEGRARPCRECGGPLRFETSEDGGVTGTCGSCGNTFTLPRRAGGGDRGGGRSGPPYGRGRPGGFRDTRRPPFRRNFGRSDAPRRRRDRDDDA